jgi:KaiC/GvpD/RAD55 family RecA-like ATPase
MIGNSDKNKEPKCDDNHNISSVSIPSQDKDTNNSAIYQQFEFEKFGIGIEDFTNEIEQLTTRVIEDRTSGLFEIMTANEAINMAKNMPDPIYLFDILILEKEISILFADTGIGKSALSVQMAIETAKKGYTTLYLDLELSKKQFQKRYTNERNETFIFPDNLYRIDFARLKKVPKDTQYVDYFFDSLIPYVEKYDAKVIFLDNLTKLAAGDTDSAKAAIPILERLNELKSKYDLTVIILEHNKKVDSSRPISLNDLQGSKMKSNLVDSIFSIGRSEKDKYVRYIKQLKVRDGEHSYDTENVRIYELSKSSGFLFFTEMGFGCEYEYLKQQTEQDREQRIKEVVEMKKNGSTNTEIAGKLSVSEGAVRKWLKKYDESKQE